jgi:hypothetical protein
MADLFTLGTPITQPIFEEVGTDIFLKKIFAIVVVIVDTLQ